MQFEPMNAVDSEKKLAELSVKLTEIQRSIGRLRHARFVGLALIFVIGSMCGCGVVVATHWSSYHDAKKAEALLRRFRAAGVNVTLGNSADGIREVAVVGAPGSFVDGARSTDGTGVVLYFRVTGR